MIESKFLLLNKDGSFQFRDPIAVDGLYLYIVISEDPFKITHPTFHDKFAPIDDLVSRTEHQYRRVRTDVDLNGLVLWVQI